MEKTVVDCPDRCCRRGAALLRQSEERAGSPLSSSLAPATERKRSCCQRKMRAELRCCLDLLVFEKEGEMEVPKRHRGTRGNGAVFCPRFVLQILTERGETG
ncbi:hypothetical protein NC653_012741 [Populus alba x Populus x berolinensis]|uniref:Uncharacterized protein n=1 Tax=Populus alba x Populus x berolinensis TaxID=444605 RepID=A0AAD6QSP2_9ROSI|nr:hypothetical protein NC653_012740 [Populus alba x Populus x berolinensis]KAJ6995952.1 hypothetical protein NC653_012741 [Populus alba x Populus x berolinensis]